MQSVSGIKRAVSALTRTTFEDEEKQEEKDSRARLVHDLSVDYPGDYLLHAASFCALAPCIEKLENLQSLHLRGPFWWRDADDWREYGGVQWETEQGTMTDVLARMSLQNQRVEERVLQNLRSLTLDFSVALIIQPLCELNLRGLILLDDDPLLDDTPFLDDNPHFCRQTDLNPPCWYYDETLPIGENSTTQGDHDEVPDAEPINSVTPKGSEAQWIKGVYICATISAVVLLINIILISVAGGLAGKKPQNTGFSATQVVYEGSCTLTKRWDVVLHLIIKRLEHDNPSCQQFFRRKWLDIGVPSVRNLSAVGRYRVTLWFILLITATPFHLLYNSAAFASVAKTGFAIILAPSDLDPGETSNLTTSGLENCFEGIVGYNWDNFVSFLANGTYERHNRQECIDLSNQKSPSTIRTMVVLTDSLNTTQGGNMAIFQSNSDVIPGNDNYTSLDCFDRIPDSGACLDASRLSYWLSYTQPQSIEVVESYIRSNLSPDITAHVQTETCLVDRYYWEDITMGDCLVIPRNGRCQLLYNPPISIAIIVTAVVKVAAMFLAAKLDRNRSEPLLTVGDAIASFLTRPDPMTRGACWMSKSDVNKIWGTLGARAPGSQVALVHGGNSMETELKPGRLTRRKLWWEAASIPRWAVTLALCGMCIGVGAYLLDQAGSAAGINNSSVKYWWQLGFGTATGSVLLQNAMQWPILGYVVVANTPQFIVTISYYFYNNVLTSMLAAAEYSSYGISRKSLRVSWPKPHSSQRSTYWLSMPYQYSVPLLITYAALHWTISQSLFYVQIVPYDMFSKPVEGQVLSALGYSPIAIFVSLLVGGVLMSAFLMMAIFRRFQSFMPLAGSCSAAIRASCHPGNDTDTQTAALGDVT
ncbi:hypothetical protein VTN00DRAFT_2963 [Thermoascus crustaceus]|uniref:uncharacterized protein n=1 Tax=Thermoascus crustaceus TaxID=5088 RepID=UPI0037449269